MTAAVATLFVLMACSLYRLAVGPTFFDRLLSLHLVSAQIILLMCIHSVRLGKAFYLDVAIVYALLSFVETFVFLRFRRPRRGGMAT
jgi:multisubunit Na+/H+ antiporter MnhF subunit